MISPPSQGLFFINDRVAKTTKLLIRTGAPIPKRYVWHDKNIQNRIVVYELAKKMEMKRKYCQLEKELKEAKRYIFELRTSPT